LIFLGQCARHCDIGFGRKQPICHGLPKGDHRRLWIDLDFSGHDFQRKLDEVSGKWFLHADDIWRAHFVFMLAPPSGATSVTSSRSFFSQSAKGS